MNELKEIIERLLAILILLYAMLFIVGGPKLANRYAKWLGENVWHTMLTIIILPFRILKNLLKKKK